MCREIYFTIIIPIYNAEKYLKRCFESILKQNFGPYEIILVNDESLDYSKAICEKYVEKYKNFFLINIKHSGASAARNKGIENASGKYIVFVDADDYVENDFLEEIYGSVSPSNPDICYFNSHYVVDGNKKRCHLVFQENLRYKKSNLTPQKFLESIALNGGNIPGSTWLMVVSNKFIQEKKIRFDEAIDWSEDTDFSYNALVKATSVNYSSYCGYNWVIDNAGSLSKQFSVDKAFGRMDIYKKWYLFFKQDMLTVNDIKVKEEITQRILEDYCICLKEYSKIKNKKEKAMMKARIKEETYIWRKCKSKEYRIYILFGIEIGNVIAKIKNAFLLSAYKIVALKK